jgi:hypothetical protein
MSSRPFATFALVAASLVLVGGVAYAAVQSVDSTPTPQVVIPAASSSDDASPTANPSPSDDGRHGADDPADHDVNDDHGGLTGDDDPATHDVGDDHGGLRDDDEADDDDDDNSGPGSDNSGPGSGSDDEADDNSGSGSGDDDGTDDSSGSGSGSDDDNSGSGSDDSGSGSGSD